MRIVKLSLIALVILMNISSLIVDRVETSRLVYMLVCYIGLLCYILVNEIEEK